MTVPLCNGRRLSRCRHTAMRSFTHWRTRWTPSHDWQHPSSLPKHSTLAADGIVRSRQMQAGVQCVCVVCNTRHRVFGRHARRAVVSTCMRILAINNTYTRNEPAHISNGERKRTMIAASLDGTNLGTHCTYSLVLAASHVRVRGDMLNQVPRSHVHNVCVCVCQLRLLCCCWFAAHTNTVSSPGHNTSQVVWRMDLHESGVRP